jgi:hypothetical protein
MLEAGIPAAAIQDAIREAESGGEWISDWARRALLFFSLSFICCYSFLHLTSRLYWLFAEYVMRKC